MERVTRKLTLPYVKCMGVWCLNQETQTGTLCQLGEVGLGEDGREVQKGGYMYICDWLILKFDRKQQNSVKQLSFNKK